MIWSSEMVASRQLNLPVRSVTALANGAIAAPVRPGQIMSLVRLFAALGISAITGAVAADGNTHIHQPPFEIMVPGTWTKAPSTSPAFLVYRSGDDQQLSISLLPSKSPLTAEEQRPMPQRIAALRRESESKESPNPLDFSPVTFTEVPLGARFTSRDAKGHRAAGTLVTVTKNGVVVIYLEVLDASPEEFSRRWSALTGATSVK